MSENFHIVTVDNEPNNKFGVKKEKALSSGLKKEQKIEKV